MNQQKSPKKKNRSLNNYAKFSGIAIQMIAIIGGGTYLGVFLDEKFPNKHSLYTVICSLFAVVISIYFVIKQIIRISNR
ncbi:AtpZ/AtpI family protein [Muricauda sp. 2012CJ35-5]|uniref:AtpZ/AtpI family protein n=1 Tax=Flagellimonas spongiicola TaxID=2942208 RepID=A0ABT0PTM3_9FLAO|nr:AtpZ/AtpI family protein [Allomuricauda spongiicola]MCL6274331.1 AtpZ/AtpI family protein [Allomuricauda spongiicola]